MTRFVTLGETMIRLTPPDERLIEQAIALEVHVGGSESNVAVGLARLGHDVAWVSRLTDNVLGRTIANAIRAQGVDIRHLMWTDEDRVGVYYVEHGPAPRGGRVLYDRANSAMSRMETHHLPDNPSTLFPPEHAGWLHTSGITVAINNAATNPAADLMQQAQGNGWRVSFDFNYRAKLWTPRDAKDGCRDYMSGADVVFIALRDAITIYDAPSEPAEALRHLHGLLGDGRSRTIVLTMGAEGAMGMQTGGVPLYQPIFPARGSGRVGGGDAFAAGFLHGFAASADLANGLLWGAAAAAYKYTQPGDMPLFDGDVLQAIIQSESGGLRR